MDKVRAFMQVMWVQRFWVLSVVGVLAAAVCWMLAAGKLQAEYAADKSAILAKFTEMKTIADKSFHGNDGVNAKEREEAAKIAENVKGLWQKLYENQREEVLFWPEEDLGQEFVEYIDKRKFDQNISPVMRDRYLNYISTRFDALVDIVDAQKVEAGAAGGFGGEGRGFEGRGVTQAMPGQPGYVEDYLVQWLDQDALRTKLTFGRTPSSREVWVRQEDLWVYEILLKAIAATNKERGATRPDNTAIRVIENLQVGAEAALANAVQPQILMPAGAAGDPSLGGEFGGEGGAYAGRGGEGMGGEGMYRGGEGMGGADPAAADAMLLQDRYVDAEGKPMTDLSTGAGVEYRRLPVRMRLQMDQRWIPKVLVECANAALPIEVQRLRINPDKSGAGFDSMASGGGEGGMYRGGGGGYGGRGGEGMSVTPGAVPADFVTVEIQGLVYIYNPPDASVLAVPGGEDDLAAAPAAEVAVVQ